MTVADAVRQPVTLLMTGIGLLLIVLSYNFGIFNFQTQDRIRMLVTAGVAIGVLDGLFLGVVLASTSVHDELADRTALTLFAKPIGRASFLVGKALGIWIAVAASVLVVAAGHVAAVLYACHTEFVVPSQRGLGGGPLWVPWGSLAGAHLLGLAGTAVMVCISTVLALRLPLVSNILISFGIFVIGHMMGGLRLMGAVVIPAMALFNVDDALTLRNKPVTPVYGLLSAVYAVLFCSGLLCLGLAFFKRQDIP